MDNLIKKEQLYACFECREVFQHEKIYLDSEAWPWCKDREQELLCPKCQEKLHEMKWNFQPPVPQDIARWTAIKTLHKCGFRFLGGLWR